MFAFKINESITQPNIRKLSPIKLKEEGEVTFTEINFSCLNVLSGWIVAETADEQHGIMRTQSRQLIHETIEIDGSLWGSTVFYVPALPQNCNSNRSYRLGVTVAWIRLL